MQAKIQFQMRVEKQISENTFSGDKKLLIYAMMNICCILTMAFDLKKLSPWTKLFSFIKHSSSTSRSAAFCLFSESNCNVYETGFNVKGGWGCTNFKKLTRVVQFLN